jgi:hypothetical protein
LGLEPFDDTGEHQHKKQKMLTRRRNRIVSGAGRSSRLGLGGSRPKSNPKRGQPGSRASGDIADPVAALARGLAPLAARPGGAETSGNAQLLVGFGVNEQASAQRLDAIS